MTETITSRIWQETPAPDNPFRPDSCRCAGFDVYNDLLGQASWSDYVLLLLLGAQPEPWQQRLFDVLAVATSNAGPRDHAVQAAMAAGAGGSSAAASLMAALAVGAGQLGGAREVAQFHVALACCGQDTARWQAWIQDAGYVTAAPADVWPTPDHPPGFDPHARHATRPTHQTLHCLAALSPCPHLPWLRDQLPNLEQLSGMGLAMTAVAAAAMADLGLDAAAAEMLFLLLRLPGAAAHALEQRERGWRDFPFYHDGMVLEPATDGSNPP